MSVCAYCWLTGKYRYMLYRNWYIIGYRQRIWNFGNAFLFTLCALDFFVIWKKNFMLVVFLSWTSNVKQANPLGRLLYRMLTTTLMKIIIFTYFFLEIGRCRTWPWEYFVRSCEFENLELKYFSLSMQCYLVIEVLEGWKLNSPRKSQCLKITEKVSFNIEREVSIDYLLSG